jgi:hypothetical protein
MRYFDRLATGAPIANLRNQLSRHPELWNADTFRTKYPGTAHVDVDDILIRFSDTGKCGTSTIVMGDGGELVWHPAAQTLTEVRPLVLALMAQVGAYGLDRVIISRIRPGGQILRHRDAAGEYVNQRGIARYHIVLNGLPGSLFRCGPDLADRDQDEVVNMQTGEVWSFDAHSYHEVINNSADDRIHLMADVRIWE